MRICVVTHYCKPHIGGIEALSLEQARLLIQHGHQVTIVSSRTQGEVPREDVEGILIHRVRAFNFLEKYFGIPYPVFAPSLLSVLDQDLDGADICIIHSLGFLSSVVAAWCCRRKGIPYILYQYNTFIDYHNPLLNIIQRINDLLFGRFTIFHAAHVLAVSQLSSCYVKSLVYRDVGVLYEAVDHNQFSYGTCKQDIRRTLGLPMDKIIVLTVGRLVFKRSVDTFISAANLLKNDSRVYFVVVGDGPDRARLTKYLHMDKLTNCILLGSIPHEAIPDYYRAADLFVLPSCSGEGMPITILEAWASGLPVISTKSGGQEEVIKEQWNGFLVQPGASHQIAQTISFLLAKPDILSMIGEHGRRTILESFTWQTHIDKLLACIVHVVHLTNAQTKRQSQLPTKGID